MKRYKHNLSNYKLATLDMGKLVPVQVQEVLPGDTMRLETTGLVRVTPQLAPVMHPVTIRFHHWFVPNRILWDGWEDFITGGPDNNNADIVPTVVVPNPAENTILDYMGVPPVPGRAVNALPVRAYNLIYNEFYRDQDLDPERNETQVGLANVSWRKDYFTASRPWPQKGPDITLPIGTEAPIKTTVGTGVPMQIISSSGTAIQMDSSAANLTPGTSAGANPTMFADLAQATGVTAVEFREFFALQRYAEARAQYGSRYSEYLRYLGVTPSDARLQRPEYLGGGKSNLQFSEVMQTTPDETGVLGTDPTSVGTLRGHGIGAVRTKSTRRFFEEHGHVITLMSVVPKSIYADGMARNWLRVDKEDYFQKELQSVGQQSMYTGEVYAKADNTDITATFGYSDRYSEYTWTPSTIAAEFRNTLDYWHMARKFDTEPALNSDFIKCDPTKRIFAEQTQHSLWCMINNKVVARRAVKTQTIGRLL